MSAPLTAAEARPLSLHEILARLGLTSEPRWAAPGHRHVLRDGVQVFSGSCFDVADWLREQGLLLCEPCPGCGSQPTADISGSLAPDHSRYVAVCGDGCYDGAPDAGPQLTTCGRTAGAALTAWDREIREESP